MTTWGFIGSGNIGTTVARLAVAAGHDVVLSNSRGAESLADVVDDLGPHATAATAAEAARDGDVVVVTIPLRKYAQVPREELRGKIVIDTMNYHPQRDGNIAELDNESTTSSALLAAHLPESKVVKGFNNIFFQHLAALPRITGAGPAAPLRSRAPTTKRRRSSLSSLTRSATTRLTSAPSQGWRTQPDTAAYGVMYAVNPQAWDQGARPASAVEVAEAAAASYRRHGVTAGAMRADYHAPQTSRPNATTRNGRR
jgi:8-hydroxy-5-deazaflavin:NADPH oxidoreductase